MEQHCPEVLAAARRCIDGSRASEGEGFVQLELAAGAFAQVPDISIDYALMEKSQRVAVVPCSIGWSDIGSWSAVGDLVAADGDGNPVEGTPVLHHVSGCYIRAQRLVPAGGVAEPSRIVTAHC